MEPLHCSLRSWRSRDVRKILAELDTVPIRARTISTSSQAQLHLAARWGGVEGELKRQSASLALLEHSTDPLVRTGFLQTYGTAVVLAAKYGEAMTIAERQLEEAKRSGLEWVTTHALELQGAALWGLRDFKGLATRCGKLTGWLTAKPISTPV